MSKPVVVGYDGSPMASLALRWGVRTAVDRALPVHLIVAWSIPGIDFGAGPSTTIESKYLAGVRIQAADILEQGKRAAIEAAGGELEVRGDVMIGGAARALVEQSRDAQLVVIGSRGLGGFAEVMLGSVSRQVATHCQCPVVVVRQPTDPAAQEVVVGVDGSDASVRAVEFAFDYASRRGLSLSVLHTWEVPPVGSFTGAPMLSPPDVILDIKGSETRATAEVIAGFQERYPDVRVHSEVIHGAPVLQLTQASEHAALLVVGSRGRGGFRGLVLGSVSHGVVHHAKCPVAIVR